MANRIVERALDTLAEAWSNIADVSLEVQQIESNPQLIQVVAPNEVVIVVSFEIKMGNRAGSMSLCVPYNVIEPVMGRLTSEDWFNQKKKTDQTQFHDSLLANMSEAKLNTRAYLAQTNIKVSDLLTLEPGDVLKTTKEASDELVCQVEGKSKFAGKIGQFRGNRAFKITRQAKPGEKI